MSAVRRAVGGRCGLAGARALKCAAGVATLVAAAGAMPSLAAPSSSPSPSPGLHFTHQDWELACDNARTCRAAGYQADADELTVSLLLTREAGPGTPVRARLQLGAYGEEAESAAAPALGPGRLKLSVNGQALGTLPWLDEGDAFGFTPAQLQAVLKALPRPNARIELSHAGQVWRLSDQGAAAVLLKMDDAQGRVGTPGALARRGTRPETQALPPLPAPVVRAARVPQPLAAGGGRTAAQAMGLSPQAFAALRDALLQDTDAEQLRATRDGEGAEPPSLDAQPLGGGKWLLSTLCWSAAYNFGSCAWVVNARAPHQPVLVTDSASDIAGGEISAAHKGRGLGDCWGRSTWTWDGSRFVLTSESTTGQCKLIAPGGAWELPTWVSRVVQP